jgi:hypothetical protein
VGVVEPLDVAEQHEQVGVHEVGDERRQPVVVPEADLAGRHGVVLVDDRQDPELEELGERLMGVAVVAAPGHVVGGEQDLAGDHTVARQLLGVAVHEQPLPHRGGGLLGRQRARPALQPQRREPGGDRTGRHQHHLDPASAGLGQDVDHPAYAVGIDPAGGGRQRRRPDLDHDASGRGDPLPAGAAGRHESSEGGSASGSSAEPIS